MQRDRSEDLYIDALQCLLLAEKLLYYQNIDGCFQTCNDLENRVIQINKDKTKSFESDFFSIRLKSIRRRLNGIIANEVRKIFETRSKKVFTNIK